MSVTRSNPMSTSFRSISGRIVPSATRDGRVAVNEVLVRAGDQTW
jgi:hypothetical protein